MPNDDLIVDTDNLVRCSRSWDAFAARYGSMLQALPDLKSQVAFGDLTAFGTDMAKQFMEVYGPAADDFDAMCHAMKDVLGQVGAGVREMARILQGAADAAADTAQGLLTNFTDSAPPSGAGVSPSPSDGSGGVGRH